MFFQLTQIGGLGDVFKKVLNWFGSILSGIFGDLLMSIARAIWEAIATFWYTISILPKLICVEAVNILFRKAVGLGTVYTQGGSPINGDFLYWLLTSDAVMSVFWAMLVLGVVLLIITTFVAVIKSEFSKMSDKESNNKWAILGTAVRAIVNFAVVPICALVGMVIGNALLKTLDGATSGGAGSSMGGRVFVSTAYSANRVRRVMEAEANGNNPASQDADAAEKYAQQALQQKWSDLKGNPQKQEEVAQYVDDQFLQDSWTWLNVVKVVEGYSLADYQFLMAEIAISAIVVMMLWITLGMIKRLFMLISLFVISPPIIAITPIVPNALKDWNKAFVSSALSAYSSVVGMNLYLLVTKTLTSLSFFNVQDIPGVNNPSGGPTRFLQDLFLHTANGILYSIVLIAGLVFVKDLTKAIAGLFGGADALGEGAAATKDIKGKVAATAAAAVGGAAIAMKMAQSTKAGLGARKANKQSAQAHEELDKFNEERQAKEKELTDAGRSKNAIKYDLKKWDKENEDRKKKIDKNIETADKSATEKMDNYMSKREGLTQSRKDYKSGKGSIGDTGFKEGFNKNLSDGGKELVGGISKGVGKIKNLPGKPINAMDNKFVIGSHKTKQEQESLELAKSKYSQEKEKLDSAKQNHKQNKIAGIDDREDLKQLEKNVNEAKGKLSGLNLNKDRRKRVEEYRKEKAEKEKEKEKEKSGSGSDSGNGSSSGSGGNGYKTDDVKKQFNAINQKLDKVLTNQKNYKARRNGKK